MLALLALGLLGLAPACAGGPALPSGPPGEVTPLPPLPGTPTPVLSPTAPGGATATPGGDALAALRARPLQIPTLAPGAACPTTPAHAIGPNYGPGLGPGPIYAILGAEPVLSYTVNTAFPAPWGGAKTLWAAPQGAAGPVLVRGRQLDGPNVLRFGPDASPAADLAFDPPSGPWDHPSTTRVQAPGCYAFQVDTPAGTTVLVFQARPSPGP